MDIRGNGRCTMFTEVTTMADGGGSVTREESGDDLLYTRVRWRGGSQVHYDDKVTVWRGVRRRRGAGTAETPVADGGRVGARPWGARRVAQGEWGRKAVRRKGVGPRRADRRTVAGLGVRAQWGRGATDARTPAWVPLWSARVKICSACLL
jgi:hypothetical protein